MTCHTRVYLRAVLAILVAFVAQTGMESRTHATEVLAHFEYECLRDTGCPHSVRTATEASFFLSVYPETIGFRGYDPGETADVTVPIEGFIADFLTSGSLSEPEPMEFLALMVGAGGGGPSLSKADWRDGIDRMGPPVRIDAGYDVPLANGIDLAGTAILTELRFQLFDLEIFDSATLSGSTMRSHYRYEFLGTRVPEPTTLLMLGLGMSTMLLCRRRAI